MDTDLIFRLLSVVLEAIIVLIGGFVVSWLRTRVNAAKLDKAITIAEIVVPAVEQAFAGVLHGTKKLEWALEWAKDLAAKHGVNLTDEQWQALIEQAVFHMNQQYGKLKDPAGDL